VSAGPKIPVERAISAIHLLAEAIGARVDPDRQDDPMTLAVVGSIRRGLTSVSDIDLIAPWAHDEDPLHAALVAKFGDPAKDKANPLFAAAVAPEGRMGIWLQGLNRNFRRCAVLLKLVKEPKVEIKVEIHRYTPGPEGNRGWIEMIRTGPAEWGRMCCIRWNHRVPNGTSDHGFLVDGDGERHPTPDEASVFRLLGLQYIPPAARTDILAKQLMPSRRRWA